MCVAIADPKSNYTQIKAVLTAICNLHELDLNVASENFKFLIEGRSAKIIFKGEKVGLIGELHPQVLDSFGLLVPVSVLEINLDRIFSLK